MQLEHEFVVPVPVAEAWDVLLDVERVAPCMPGARVDAVEGDTVTGTVTVKVGPIKVAYGGQARFAEKDAQARRVVLEASGRETRGAGTAAATIRASLAAADGDATRVSVVTDLTITGKPAQFGRGVLADVGSKILGQFADCLADLIAAGPAERAPAGAAEAATGGAAEAATAGAAEAATGVPPPVEPAAPERQLRRERPTPEAIDLLGTAGVPVLRRIGAPLAAALVALVVLIRLLRRRRRSR